ncbi:helix-turn-helix domain-containing protein [Chryseobacterium indoltheticum]|uniref:XRE family transcriptional regulator n=1 Tax=Chryseobacterium indoltheticum TaxID=254 RepID=A0A3G6N003_9FLAO|nr:hypothetical protein [Chryseobacterium indoltheticum]AZA60827.1 hypothetical protein EG340_07125 [Chryseobacterium indoltheticum]
MNSKERLEQILLHLKLSANKLSKEIGHSSNVKLHHVKSGRNEISEEIAKDIEKYFPEFNYEWIVTGKGQMLKNNNTINSGEFSNLTIDEKLEFLHTQNLELQDKLRLSHLINRTYLRSIAKHLNIKKEEFKDLQEMEDDIKKISSN